ncbi:putative DNA-binding transcriptional regulator YafY [Prauserella shujinwangii]|uniref:Putative DNA-binding transcriptional regulator YafY n=1 Tax=Prauserella shujinwangii TaxID=1453103 RepID=A0A2T0M3X1_9PSEU|nr:YafY family protein [Prauserella shujinwangii]PRX51443.1 putative DNA-binding transcriptional regulator YafY [Prauserella shujinwangii]
MANTSTRMLRLLSLLQSHRFWPGAELATRLGVSQRTLRRDIDRVRELGYQVTAHPGVAGGYRLRPGSRMPPLLLDDEESVAVVAGLLTAANGAAAGVEETSVQALSKLMAVMPPRLRDRIDALTAATVPAVVRTGQRVDAGTLITIAQACRHGERLRFGYVTAGGDRTTRVVEPHRLVPLDRRWYLLAWDLGREDWRQFRVDRMAQPEPTGTPCVSREVPGGDAGAFVRARIADRPAKYVVEVRVNAAASAVREVVERWGRVTHLDERECLLRMDVDTLDWPTLVLASVGADFEVVRPPELREHIVAVAQALLRGGRGPG